MKRYMNIGGLLVVIGLVVATFVYFREEKAICLVCEAEYEGLAQVLVQVYEKENTEQEVEIIIIDDTTNIESIVDKADADIILGRPQVLENVKRLRPLDKEKLLEEGIPAYVVSGDKDVFSLPLGIHVPIVFYNKKLFETENISIPENIYNFLILLADIESRNICPIAMMQNKEGNRDFTPLLNSVLSNSATLESDTSESIETEIAWLKEALEGRVLKSEYSPLDFTQMQTLLLEKKVGMVFGNSTVLGQNLDKDIGFFYVSGFGMSEYLPCSTEVAVSIPNTKKNHKKGEDFLLALLSEQAQLAIYEELEALPICDDVAVSGAFVDVYESVQRKTRYRVDVLQAVEIYKESFDEADFNYPLMMY